MSRRVVRRCGIDTIAAIAFALGARATIDLLARHAPTHTLLVVEIRTDLLDVQDAVGTLDRKRRSR